MQERVVAVVTQRRQLLVLVCWRALQMAVVDVASACPRERWSVRVAGLADWRKNARRDVVDVSALVLEESCVTMSASLITAGDGDASTAAPAPRPPFLSPSPGRPHILHLSPAPGAHPSVSRSSYSPSCCLSSRVSTLSNHAAANRRRRRQYTAASRTTDGESTYCTSTHSPPSRTLWRLSCLSWSIPCPPSHSSSIPRALHTRPCAEGDDADSVVQHADAVRTALIAMEALLVDSSASSAE